MAKAEKQMKAAEVERLRSMFPGIYSDFLAGRIGSLRVALELAGLRSQRSRLEKLKNSWKKAGIEERQAFVAWLATQQNGQELESAVSRSALSVQKSASGPIANGRYLLPETIIRIEAVMARRRLKPGEVMQELGFGANDRSLLKALARKAALRLKAIAALESWLAENELS
ncbi:hypothetical protein [Agrobacterium vitis]|nr:hypothetical protein [Agrobacterium vitis]